MTSITDDPNHPGIKRGGADDAPVPQNGTYLVLSAEERVKGFVRPVRDSYVHVGAPHPKYPLRDLTAEEIEQYKGTVLTKMGRELAETYARQPDFYGATYCVGCSKHRPVGEGGEFVWAGTNERVGT